MTSTEQNQSYKIHMTQGQGGCVVESVPTLEEAIAFCLERTHEGSFAVECPDGKWFQWS